MVDPVPTNSPEAHSQLDIIFKDKDAVIRRNITRESALTVLSSIGCRRGSIWTIHFSMRYCGTQERLADMLTKGSFTTIHWNSLLQLLDIHPPQKLVVLQCLRLLLTPCPTALTPSSAMWIFLPPRVNLVLHGQEHGKCESKRHHLVAHLIPSITCNFAWLASFHKQHSREFIPIV